MLSQLPAVFSLVRTRYTCWAARQSAKASDGCVQILNTKQDHSGRVHVGYDGGITGGIVVMQPFAEDLFPSTVGVPDTNFYCKYDDRVLQTFASIMHFTGALAAFPAGYFTAKYGRTR